MRDVLIVDDSLTVRMDLKDAFAAAGFDPTLCNDLACARAELARRRFSLVVLDVLLPDGDGIDLLGEMKVDPVHGATPVVMLSTEAEVRHRIRGLRTGADDYVGKPYDATYVIARAHDLVRRTAPPADVGVAPVLVVDDSLTAREELRATLEAAGFEVVTAASGEEGLRVAADRRPSAIVVDGVMPGIDGASFVRQLRADAALRTTPCILLTASTAGGELRALEAGADAYLLKEDGHDVVVARIQALIRSSGPRATMGAAGILSPKRILAIGGDEASLRDVSERLRMDGHELVLAHDEEEAVALLAVDRGVDGILVDGTAGLDQALSISRRLKSDASWREIPLVVVGREGEQERLVEVINAGADDYVGLSQGLEVVRARVRAQLRRKQFGDENRSRDAFARSAAILETIGDAFFAVNQQWRFIYVNSALEGLVGASRRELVGNSLWEHCPWLGAEERRYLTRAAEERVPVTFEVATPEERWLEVRAFAHGRGLTVYLRDVTERRRSQEVQAHMLGIVGHDLRTPLAVISTSTEIALRDKTMSERSERALGRALASVTRMNRLIADLLDYSRARLGQGLRVQVEPVDLERLSRDVIDDVKASHPGRRVAFETLGGAQGEWDPLRMQQVLGNLLTNALRYSPPESEVSVTIREDAGRTLVLVHNEGAIDEHLQAHIFEPFKRGEGKSHGAGGVGLGLYIVRQIVAAHGGTVVLTSSQAEGTTFTVSLPTHPPPAR
ncbi:MAG TPA: response regulator [Anaeromyxobacteraceae bacterium]|nr:response regulator [Anaeromyxobacteraceae bacterium]